MLDHPTGSKIRRLISQFSTVSLKLFTIRTYAGKLRNPVSRRYLCQDLRSAAIYSALSTINSDIDTTSSIFT